MRKILPLVGCVWLAAACSKTPSESAATAAPSPANPPDPMAISLDQELRQHVRVGTAQWATITSTLTVTARLKLDATRTAGIGSPVLGRVVSIKVEEGQDVVRSQVLAEIQTPDGSRRSRRARRRC